MKLFWMKLSKREKTLVGAAVFVLLLVLGRFFVVSPYLERRAWVKDQLDVLPPLHEKNIQHLGEREAIGKAFEKAKIDLQALEKFLLSGDTPSVSASSLQEMIRTIADKEGTQIITTRVLNPEATGKYTKIPIQVELSGEIEQVVNLLKGVEAAEKLLVIDELNIRSLFRPATTRSRGAAARRRTRPQTAAGRLRARLIISGIARSQQNSGTGPQSQTAR
jgi:type II secretory pathway component PulM